MHYTAQYHSPLGTIRITAEDDAIVSLVFTEDNGIVQSFDPPVLRQCICWLEDYFSGKMPDPTVIPVHLNGSPFQKKIWKILQEIPYGHSVTYGQIAKMISPKMSAQAVGRAVGSNPVSIIVPCHRVLGKGSKLAGYAYGVDRKQMLLDLEKIPYQE